MLTFDFDKHAYYWKGRQVRSVTQVLKPLRNFDGIPYGVLEHKRQIGQAVDAAITLDIGGDLDEASLDEEAAPYFKAWRVFQFQTGFEVLSSQGRHYNQAYDYAGTYDLYGMLNAWHALIDVKTELNVHGLVALQTMAYWKMLIDDNAAPARTRRYSLQLRNDGTYRLDELKGKGDWNAFVTMLNYHRLREKYHD